MPRFHDLQPAFNAGELSPRLHSRLDFNKYASGLETCQNLIPLSEGGVMRRPGTRYVAEIKSSSVVGRLKPFQFSTTQAYMLEMCNTAIRFYRHQGQITVADTDAAVHNGLFATALEDSFAQVWQVDDTPSGNAFVDETADANSATDADWDLFPATEAIGDYAAFGYANIFAELRFDYVNGTAGVGGTVAWEYWNGSAWTALAGVTDNTNGFTAVAADNLTVNWTIPTDWAATVINGSSSLYYVRARVTGTYGPNPVMDQGFIRTWKDESTGGAGNQISRDATNSRLTLETSGSAADDIGWASQGIITTNTNQEHVLKFQVIGAPGDKVEFQVGTTSTGAETLAVADKEVGYHCVAFTPTTAVFFIQFRNRGSFRDKDVQIDNVSLIDNAPVEIETPYAEADLFEVGGPQTADVLYLFHESYAPHKLQRFGHTTWSLTEIAWQDGPYLDENTTATTLAPSAATGLGIDLTLSSIAGVNDGQGWLSTDVGRLVRYKKSAAWGYAVIVSITSTTVAVADVRADFEPTPDAQTTWRLGAWSGTTGYPRTGIFYEQRTYAAGTTNQPQTLWATQTADFENFKPDDDAGKIEADDALQFTLSADSVNAIRWLAANSDALVIGTVGGEWVATSDAATIQPTDITIHRVTSHGSSTVQPVSTSNVVLFNQKAKRKVREFGKDDLTGTFSAPDMTRLAEHITYGGITEMALAEEPESQVFAVRNDGQLLSMTYRREEDVVGWSRYLLGGEFLTENTALTRVWMADISAQTFTGFHLRASSPANADVTFTGDEQIGDYMIFGYIRPFQKLTFDYANGTAGKFGTIIWEYYDGSGWAALSNVTDNTTGFTAAVADGVNVTWDIPDDWDSHPAGGPDPLYYVRARVTKLYTINPVFDQVLVQDKVDASVESVAVIPGDNGAGQTQDSTSRDEVWVIVKRTINGNTKRYVEFFERSFETGHDQTDAYYADSLITYDNLSGSDTMTGLDHLEGETVKVWADGSIFPDATVASGQITLTKNVRVAQIGLPYTHSMKTLRLSGGNPAGTAMGKIQRIYAITFVLLNSHTLTYGPDSSNLATVDFRQISDPMDAGVRFFTGQKRVTFPAGYSTDGRVVIESSDPCPFTITALAPEIELNPLK